MPNHPWEKELSGAKERTGNLEEKQKVASGCRGLWPELGDLGTPGCAVFALAGKTNTEREAQGLSGSPPTAAGDSVRRILIFSPLSAVEQTQLGRAAAAPRLPAERGRRTNQRAPALYIYEGGARGGTGASPLVPSLSSPACRKPLLPRPPPRPRIDLPYLPTEVSSIR